MKTRTPFTGKFTREDKMAGHQNQSMDNLLATKEMAPGDTTQVTAPFPSLEDLVSDIRETLSFL